MAYNATVTLTHHGGRDYSIVINETEAGAATEATITGLPIKGRVVSQIAQLVSGTGTTIDPILGTATDPSSNANSIVVENDTAAAAISNLASPEVPYITTNGTLYHRSVCDAGADNTVQTTYLLKAGW